MTKLEDMDNFKELFFYAIFLLVSWAISSMGKKKKKAKFTPPTSEETKTPTPTINWGDLANQMLPTSKKEESDKPTYETYEEGLNQYEKEHYETNLDQYEKEHYETNLEQYEKENYETVLESFEKTSVKKEYEASKPKKRPHNKVSSTGKTLRNQLKDKNNIRTAFVLKEILERKF